MATKEYIGARYVPLFADPIEWDKTKSYEPLTIVCHSGNSYTSRQYVPADIELTDETYWALTGNYNAQVEQYRKDTATVKTALQTETDSRENADTALSNRIGPLENAMPTKLNAVAHDDTIEGTGTPTDALKVKLNRSTANNDTGNTVYPALTKNKTTGTIQGIAFNAGTGLTAYDSDNADIGSGIQLSDTVLAQLKTGGHVAQTYQIAYDTIAEMTADDTLTANTVCCVKPENNAPPYYKIVDAVTDNDIHETLNNGLHALLLLANDIVNLAIMNLNVDDSAVPINKIMAYARAHGKHVFYLPQGTYTVKTPICMYDDDILIGEGRFNTILKEPEDSAANYAIIKGGNPGVANVTIKNIGFNVAGHRTASFVDTTGCHSWMFDRIQAAARKDPSGNNATFQLGGPVAGYNNFLFTVQNSRFSRVRVRVSATDSYIVNNEIWGNDLAAFTPALHITQTLALVQGNQIVAPEKYYGIVLQADLTRIIANYFDGNDPANILTGDGLNIVNAKNNAIVNNMFWRIQKQPIHMEGDCAGTNIANNTFYEGGWCTPQVADIHSSGTSILINNNIFNRGSKYYSGNRTTNVPTIEFTTGESGYSPAPVGNISVYPYSGKCTTTKLAITGVGNTPNSTFTVAAK
jgi:hypothetical protein